MVRTRKQEVIDPSGIEARLCDLGPLPRLVAFDLDYTLWPVWVDTHVTPPLRPSDDRTSMVDRHGYSFSFYPHVPVILSFLRNQGVIIAAASRTSAPNVARQALSGLAINNKASLALFHHLEIYPGSKITHFHKINKAANVPFEDMVFFDDERRNAEVGHKLGVHFVEVSNRGTDIETFERGIKEWQAKRAKREHEHT